MGCGHAKSWSIQWIRMTSSRKYEHFTQNSVFTKMRYNAWGFLNVRPWSFLGRSLERTPLGFSGITPQILSIISMQDDRNVPSRISATRRSRKWIWHDRVWRKNRTYEKCVQVFCKLLTHHSFIRFVTQKALTVRWRRGGNLIKKIKIRWNENQTLRRN